MTRQVVFDPVERDAYVEDLLGIIEADKDMELTKRTREALCTLSLSQIQDLHELIVYCGTH